MPFSLKLGSPDKIHNLTSTLVVIAGVMLLTVAFVYLQLIGKGYFVYLWFLALILILFLTKSYLSKHWILVRVLLMSGLIMVCLMFGIVSRWSDPFHVIVMFLVLILPIFIMKPKIMAYIFLLILFSIPYSTYGITKTTLPMPIFKLYYGIYTRGAGLLPLSVINLFLILIAFSIILREIAKPYESTSKEHCNLYKYFWIFNAYFFLHVLWSVVNGGSVRENLVAIYGVTNIINLSIFVFIMLRIFRTEDDVKKLTNFFLGMVLFKNIWYIFRFFFLGGDINNPYVNHGTNMSEFRISVFDIGDGIIEGMTVFYVLRILLDSKMAAEIDGKRKMFYIAIALTDIFNMIFSYRRTVWFGLLLMFCLLFVQLPAIKRIAIGLLLIIMAGVMGLVAANRFQERDTGIVSDITKSGKVSTEGRRFEELSAAWWTMKQNFWFGVGPSGSHQIQSNISITKENKDFLKTVHSSVLYIGFKLGVVGLTIYLLFYAAYLNFWSKVRREIWASRSLSLLGETGFAGFIFIIPSILFSPMINEFRTMLLLGFCLVLPYIAYNVQKNIRLTLLES
ncbi:MAG: O-antigen ligase domain-containing protein [Nitrospiraceae bacterium]|nr:MAG: O-antigen ligase domain-containing protein [Nitrospiraceae bacterium]